MKDEERIKQFQTVEDSLVLTDLMQKGANLSLGMINKYVMFTNMQKTPLTKNNARIATNIYSINDHKSLI
ncbi:Uncharacterised protein [Lederbergia lenta]|uniref:Uncharacterized protein n=1 Tax=Lederbergia lenta TaxID=1467 RepID=A0A2X4W9J8_LEDLE|nr:Uncharacterised protein [Lederbergia lenta]